MHYARTVFGYHGCDAEVAEKLLAGEAFEPSDNDFDWLGRGIYFWEYGLDRALRFAHEQKDRGKVKTPAVVGAMLQLGQCFDLLDTRFTTDLYGAFPLWKQDMLNTGATLPVNGGPGGKLRRLDCAVLNWYLNLMQATQHTYDCVRGGFTEGDAVFPGSGIQRETHIQIAVRNAQCILGVFRPTPGRKT